jgi:deazaflavin-dependent oxidoreductase (nitroreductase family)
MSGNAQIIAEFRANGGIVGGRFAGGTLLLLHTVGARSELGRINPLVYVTDRHRYVVAASKGGAATHPDWYFNLQARPDVQLEVGVETIRARAAFPIGAERDELYSKLTARYPFFAGYQEGTSRIIPVVTLDPHP